MNVVVIAVGNEFRHDDAAALQAAGLLAAQLCAEDPMEGLEIVTLDGEPARMVEAWDGAELAVVLDAARTGAPPGTIHRLLPPLPTPATRISSSHSAGVSEALRLGEALGRRPDRLVVLAVEGARFDEGQGLSAEVEGALWDLVSAVREELLSGSGA